MFVRMKMLLYLAAILTVAYAQGDRISECPSVTIMDPFQISNVSTNI